MFTIPSQTGGLWHCFMFYHMKSHDMTILLKNFLQCHIPPWHDMTWHGMTWHDMTIWEETICTIPWLHPMTSLSFHQKPATNPSCRARHCRGLRSCRAQRLPQAAAHGLAMDHVQWGLSLSWTGVLNVAGKSPDEMEVSIGKCQVLDGFSSNIHHKWTFCWENCYKWRFIAGKIHVKWWIFQQATFHDTGGYMGNRAGSDRSTQVKKIELCMVQFIASPPKKWWTSLKTTINGEV